MKDFILIGNKSAVTYKEIFPLIKERKITLGNTTPGEYISPEGVPTTNMQGLTRWFTTLPVTGKKKLTLTQSYYDNPSKYPHYDNYDAIEVSKTCDIPMDYDGVMGVPITFLDKYCPEQLEIVGLDRYVEDNPHYGHRFTIGGKETYARILIQNNTDQFEIVGATESEGTGFSNGVFTGGSVKQALVNGNKVYKRLFIRNNNPENTQKQ